MELAANFAMSLPAVSQHLKVLREAGLVNEERRGRQRVYSIAATPLREVADWVSHYEQFWQKRLARLGEHLKKKP
jgi:DNA-binding transcriptional ArsR family regulator